MYRAKHTTRIDSDLTHTKLTAFHPGNFRAQANTAKKLNGDARVSGATFNVHLRVPLFRE
jgi:hypothetical protein